MAIQATEKELAQIEGRKIKLETALFGAKNKSSEAKDAMSGVKATSAAEVMKPGDGKDAK